MKVKEGEPDATILTLGKLEPLPEAHCEEVGVKQRVAFLLELPLLLRACEGRAEAVLQ